MGRALAINEQVLNNIEKAIWEQKVTIAEACQYVDICYNTLAKYFKKHPEERERIKALRKMATKKDVRHPLRTMSDVGFKNLAFAVVQLAVKDYKATLKQLHRNPRDEKARLMKEECENFFLNEDKFVFYSDLSGKDIMKQVQKKVRKKWIRY